MGTWIKKSKVAKETTHHNTDWRAINKSFIQNNLTKKERLFVRYATLEKIQAYLAEGKLFRIGNGISKIGYDFSPCDMPNLAIKILADEQLSHLGNQLDSEIEAYKQIIANGDKDYFIPFFRAWVGKKGTKGEALVLCYRAQVVDSLYDLLHDYSTPEKMSEFEKIVEKYNLDDIWHNGGNACLVAGEVKILDFGLPNGRR